METAFVQALIGSGPIGLACWILLQQRKEDRAERAQERAERLELDKERLASERKLAAAITILALKITGKPFDGDAA
jgi:hypothetical protein